MSDADPNLGRVYAKLREIRSKKDLTLKPNRYLKDTFTGFDGEEHPLKVRYYQIQAVLHLYMMKRFLLGDDTGVGKTLSSIAALCTLWEKDPNFKAVILTNKSAVAQWAKEFRKFTRGITVITVKGTPEKREAAYRAYEEATGPTAIIMGYRSSVQDFTRLQKWKGHTLIADEATAFKNHKTQVHQVIRHLGAPDIAERVWCLTATLIKNNLMEGYGIYRVLVPGLFAMSQNQFMIHYAIIRMQQIRGRRQIPVVVGHTPEQLEEFRKVVEPYYLGRPKHEIADELPVLTTKRIFVGLTEEQEDKYDEALDGLLTVGTRAGAETEDKETTILTALIYCQQIVNHLDLIDCEGDSDKLDNLIDLLKNGELADEKVILFTRFKKMVNYLEPLLKKEGIKAVRITGDEDGDQRQAAQDAFQDPNNPTRVVMITMAGSDAINLQAAKAIVFYDAPWSFGDYLQILGRMLRIGSTHDRCYALHLVSRRKDGTPTIDGRVMEVLQRKRKIVEAVLGKRLVGEEEHPVEASAGTGMKDLFSILRGDAQGRKGHNPKPTPLPPVPRSIKPPPVSTPETSSDLKVFEEDLSDLDDMFGDD